MSGGLCNAILLFICGICLLIIIYLMNVYLEEYDE